MLNENMVSNDVCALKVWQKSANVKGHYEKYHVFVKSYGQMTWEKKITLTGTYNLEIITFINMIIWIWSFLPEASFGLRVLSSPASVYLSVCPCVCVSITCLSAR